MTVVLLGSGNVATHLGHTLTGKGYRILQVYSRTRAHAQSLADALHTEAIDDLAQLNTTAAIYIIAVNDDAIPSVLSQLPSSLDGMVLHTAGSVAINIFEGYVARYGVLYPVQTFSGAKKVDFSIIPLAIEASDDEMMDRLYVLANGLSDRVFACDSEQRIALHAAAVFACNFTNHLYTIAANILHDYQLGMDLIRPLILETAEKVMTHEPKDVQTGPAVRNDRETQQKHLDLLKARPDMMELYQLLSRSIGKQA